MQASGNGLVELVERLPARGLALWHRLKHRSSSNFKFAFLFLGQHQREALEQVYGFCRVVDDIVDEREPGPSGQAAAEAGLALWRREVRAIYESEAPTTELGRSLLASNALFHYPRSAFDDIIAGVEMDLDHRGFKNLGELRLYCYRVASCVGFLCIAVFGRQTAAAKDYAEHLGLALQYTNILRDVAEDAARGRVYIPEDLLARHGLSRADILAQRYDDAFVAAASELAAIAEGEYAAAWAALATIPEQARELLPAEIMGRTYHLILQEIRARRFNVFVRRATLRRRDKLKVAAMAIARSGLSLT